MILLRNETITSENRKWKPDSANIRMKEKKECIYVLLNGVQVNAMVFIGDGSEVFQISPHLKRSFSNLVKSSVSELPCADHFIAYGIQ